MYHVKANKKEIDSVDIAEKPSLIKQFATNLATQVYSQQQCGKAHIYKKPFSGRGGGLPISAAD